MTAAIFSKCSNTFVVVVYLSILMVTNIRNLELSELGTWNFPKPVLSDDYMIQKQCHPSSWYYLQVDLSLCFLSGKVANLGYRWTREV